MKWGDLLRRGYGVEDVAVITGDPVHEIRGWVSAMRAMGQIKNLMWAKTRTKDRL